MPTPVVVTRIQNRRGTQAQFNGPAAIYPSGYDGIGGFGSIPGYTLVNFPNVLLPGELALCTDSRNIYMGNINGEYVLVGSTGGGPIELKLEPITVTLPATGIFTTIVEATLTPLNTPFFNILYSLTDNPGADWNLPGTNFARNGQLQVTSVGTSPTLADIGTEINLTANAISFQAVYNAGDIEIQYTHNFAGPLTFNTSTLCWVPF